MATATAARSMCGRTRIAMSREALEEATGVPQDRWRDAERCDLYEFSDWRHVFNAGSSRPTPHAVVNAPCTLLRSYVPRNNVQPGAYTPVLRLDATNKRCLQSMKCGTGARHASADVAIQHAACRSRSMLAAGLLHPLSAASAPICLIDGVWYPASLALLRVNGLTTFAWYGCCCC